MKKLSENDLIVDFTFVQSSNIFKILRSTKPKSLYFIVLAGLLTLCSWKTNSTSPKFITRKLNITAFACELSHFWQSPIWNMNTAIFKDHFRSLFTASGRCLYLDFVLSLSAVHFKLKFLTNRKSQIERRWNFLNAITKLEGFFRISPLYC